MKLKKLAGATSEIWQVFIRDSSSTTGAGLIGLTNASSSLTAYYHRDTDTTATAISLVTMTVGTFTSSGFKEIDATNMPGWYQLCPPNAALASGAKSCAFHLKGAANMAPLPIEVQLVSYDPDNATSLGLSRLDAAISSRMATYTQPTGFLAATFPGTVASTTNITAASGVALSAAGVQAIWDALTSALTTVGSVGKLLVDNINATISSRLASASYTAPDNTSITAIKTQTDKLTFTVANQIDANVLDWKSATAPAMTGDAYARLGAPAGVSVSADVAAVKSDTGTILTDVNTGAGAIYTRIGAPVGASIAADIAALPTANGNADAFLDRSAAIETGVTPRGLFRLLGAVIAGKVSGAGTTTNVFRNAVADSKDRVTATVDASGNRTAITTDVT